MKKDITVEDFGDGYAILGDSTDPNLIRYVRDNLVSSSGLIVTDPPYGNIVNEKWDKVKIKDTDFSEWMIGWTKEWSDNLLDEGGAFYVWGGIGTPLFRPFLRYMHDVEVRGKFELANLITWKKRRGYGVQNNYLFTREECAYFIKGNAKKPKKFNIPLLDEKRGYAGYNPKYPAKSEYFRRSNVWTDINEIFQGKVHPTQKAQKLIEVVIEVHTDPGEWVIDPFAGGGTSAFAARKLGRKFLIVEREKEYFETLVKNLRVESQVGAVQSGEENSHDK